VYLARGQAQKVDRVFTDAADRFRGQLLHIDRILTGTMEAVEDAGTQFRQSFWRPVQKASALVQGIKVGLDLLRARKGGTLAIRAFGGAGRGIVYLEAGKRKLNSKTEKARQGSRFFLFG